MTNGADPERAALDTTETKALVDLSIAIVTNGNRAPAKLVTRCAPIGSRLRRACRRGG